MPGRTVAFVQARMESTRLPGKVMTELGGSPVIDWVLRRTAQARHVNEVWLVTSTDASNDPLAAHVDKLGFRVFRGSENDVLARFAAAAQQAKADTVVRITGDCPFVDPGVIDAVIELRRTKGVDYATNTNPATFPDGLDVEVFTREALAKADIEAKDPILREHVTPYISGKRADILPAGSFTRASLKASADFSHLRWTVDTPADLAFARAVAASVKPDFDWQELVSLLTRKPELLRLNDRMTRNETTTRAINRRRPSFETSQTLFARASRTVPLASQTFSKSYQQWVLGASPLFLERGRGARVWDVDGNDYLDYVLGLLPIILGYGDPDMDAAVRDQLERGVLFSLPSRLEMEVAERLVRLIPCAEMVRFGKNGSDATTAAIRLARAHTGRDRVAVGGYHGWHDWYIGTTSRHLGVPDEIRRLSAAFPFNDADALEALLKADPNGYAAIILEPAGTEPPASGFLQRVRALADRFGVVLIFDEIITGFRINLGGAQAEYGVTPDLACFGKAMANGMPLSAIVGRAPIMKRMEDIFFSGTFGGETLSLAAAAATLDKLERESVVPRLYALGAALTQNVRQALAEHGMQDMLAVTDVAWWPRLIVKKSPVEPLLLVSLLRQEFVRHGLLLGASFNLCLAHDSPSMVEETTAAFKQAIAIVREALDRSDPAACLRGEMIRPTFAVRR